MDGTGSIMRACNEDSGKVGLHFHALVNPWYTLDVRYISGNHIKELVQAK